MAATWTRRQQWTGASDVAEGADVVDIGGESTPARCGTGCRSRRFGHVLRSSKPLVTEVRVSIDTVGERGRRRGGRQATLVNDVGGALGPLAADLGVRLGGHAPTGE